jgi:hypothetical protein
MDADAEGEMAGEVEAVRVREPGRIAVRSAVEADHKAAPAKRLGGDRSEASFASFGSSATISQTIGVPERRGSWAASGLHL